MGRLLSLWQDTPEVAGGFPEIAALAGKAPEDMSGDNALCL
jgi:hypothetical protein